MTGDELAAAKAAYEAIDWAAAESHAGVWAAKYGEAMLAALSARDAEIERLHNNNIRQTITSAQKLDEQVARATAAEAQVRGLREALQTMLVYLKPQHYKGACIKCGKQVPFVGAGFCSEECGKSKVDPIAIAEAALAPAPAAAHGEAGTLTVDAAARRLMEAVRRYIDNPSDTQLRKDVLDADAAFRAAKNGGGE